MGFGIAIGLNKSHDGNEVSFEVVNCLMSTLMVPLAGRIERDDMQKRSAKIVRDVVMMRLISLLSENSADN